jgi:DNA-binding NtrC family response regulator
VDVRFVTATHQDLERLIREGRFRADLYYRLNVITMNMPPLRERGEDTIELAHYFLRSHAQRCRKSIESIDDDALLALRFYSWPGNIRELENAIERAVIVAESPSITLGDLPAEFRHSPRREAATEEPNGGRGTAPLRAARTARHARERQELLLTLDRCGGNRTEAARRLGLARSTLLARMKKFGLLSEKG